MKCLQCTDTTDDDGELCAACSVELGHRLMAAEPADYLYCEACRAPFSYTEARVLRHAKNPSAAARGSLSQQTPRLCWVCARLHHSAHQPENPSFSM